MSTAEKPKTPEEFPLYWKVVQYRVDSGDLVKIQQLLDENETSLYEVIKWDFVRTMYDSRVEGTALRIYCRKRNAYGEGAAEKEAGPRMCPQCGEPIVCRCLSRGRAKCPIHGEPLPQLSPPPADAPAKMWLAYGPVCLHASFFEREDAEEYIEQKVMKPHDWTILEYDLTEPSPPSGAPLNTKWEGSQGHNAMCGFVTGAECDCGWSAYCDRLISSAELKKLKLAALGDGGESAEQEQNKAGAASSGAGFNAPPLEVHEPSPVEPSPPSAAPLEHGMNCRGTTPGNEAECTCGLHWRIQLQTEREMHNAWRKRAEEAERELAERVAPEPAPLFKTGGFRLHSGEQSDFKIDCDALSDSDWESLAHMVADRVGKFSSVEGVPQGGLKLAEKLQSQVWSEGPILIVDDVLTTGASMEQQRAGRDAIGAVIFARSQPPEWITPLFTLVLPRPNAAPDWIEQCAHEIRVWLYGDVRSEDFNVHTEKQVAALIWQRAERVAPEPARTPEQYAIEHGRYLADAAEQFQKAYNELSVAQESNEDALRDCFGDCFRALSSAIYEFRKRAAKAERVGSAALPREGE